jgi:hypothetical protein
LKAQFILAGQYRPIDHYYDIIPDDTIKDVQGNVAVYPLDLNNDGVMDIELRSFNGIQTQWGDSNYCMAIPQGYNQIAFGYVDSCFDNAFLPDTAVFVYESNMAKAFSYGDTIDTKAHWVNSSVYFSRAQHIANFPTQVGYGCFSSTFTENLKYLGVRIFNGTDTLYGWVHVDSIPFPYTFMVLKEVAYNGGQTDLGNNNSLKVYPNPSSNNITVLYPHPFSQQAILQVFDLLGRSVWQETLNTGQSKTEVDVSYFADGLYFIELQLAEGIARAKFVKQ